MGFISRLFSICFHCFPSLTIFISLNSSFKGLRENSTVSINHSAFKIYHQVRTWVLFLSFLRSQYIVSGKIHKRTVSLVVEPFRSGTPQKNRNIDALQYLKKIFARFVIHSHNNTCNRSKIIVPIFIFSYFLSRKIFSIFNVT